MIPLCDLFDSRLMEQLLEKEREYQAILQQVLQERETEIRLLRLRSEPAGVDFSPIYLFTLDRVRLLPVRRNLSQATVAHGGDSSVVKTPSLNSEEKHPMV